MSGRKKKDVCAEYERVRDLALSKGVDVSEDEWELLGTHAETCNKHVVPPSVKDEDVMAVVKYDQGMLLRDPDIARRYLEQVTIEGKMQ